MELFRFPCSSNAKDHKCKWTIGIIWPRIAFNYRYLILNHSGAFSCSPQSCQVRFLYEIFVQHKHDQNNNKQISTSSPSLPLPWYLEIQLNERWRQHPGSWFLNLDVQLTIHMPQSIRIQACNQLSWPWLSWDGFYFPDQGRVRWDLPVGEEESNNIVISQPVLSACPTGETEGGQSMSHFFNVSFILISVL